MIHTWDVLAAPEHAATPPLEVASENSVSQPSRRQGRAYPVLCSISPAGAKARGCSCTHIRGVHSHVGLRPSSTLSCMFSAVNRVYIRILVLHYGPDVHLTRSARERLVHQAAGETSNPRSSRTNSEPSVANSTRRPTGDWWIKWTIFHAPPPSLTCSPLSSCCSRHAPPDTRWLSESIRHGWTWASSQPWLFRETYKLYL